MKILSGSELAGYIKERQAKQARALMAQGRRLKLAIFYDNDSPVILKYIKLKEGYGRDIGVEVVARKINAENATRELNIAAEDATVTGIVVQLPLKTVGMEILDLIPFSKDVDGLRGESDTATARAIHWLLTGYGVELGGKKLAIVGHGKLVGAPLEKMWRASGYDVTVFDIGDDLARLVDFDLVVSATGVPQLIRSEMLREGAVVVDAGTASEGGVIRGDLDETVYTKRQDLTLTPRVGGVGPLTVAMLFEGVVERGISIDS